MLTKCVVVPDSFKGSLSSVEVCRITRQTLLRHFPQCTVDTIPVADGGEGTVDCLLNACGGTRVQMMAEDPFGSPITACYGILPDGVTAVIEMAATAGLPLVEGRADPTRTSTYGVGQLIADALQRGCRHILLGLGGSCTNDAGCGMAAALGVRFLDADGRAFRPTGGTLCQIASIDFSGARLSPDSCTLTAMCDVTNPLCGPTGAAAVFAPQKGASPAQVKQLDDGLAHWDRILQQQGLASVLDLPGAGAAGGMGGGVVSLLGGRLRSGIDAVLETVRFAQRIQNADLIITGEGKIDCQSLDGKVLSGVGRYAAAAGVPVIALAGAIDPGAEALYNCGISAMFSINRTAQPFSVARCHAAENLTDTLDSICRLWGAMSAT